MGDNIGAGDLWDASRWSATQVTLIGLLTAWSLAFVPAAVLWFAWVTFYPLPYTGSTPPPDVIASLPVMGTSAIVAALSALAWSMFVAVNGRTNTAKVLWALGVLVGGGIVQSVAFFFYVWEPWRAAMRSKSEPATI